MCDDSDSPDRPAPNVDCVPNDPDETAANAWESASELECEIAELLFEALENACAHSYMEINKYGLSTIDGRFDLVKAVRYLVTHDPLKALATSNKTSYIRDEV